MTGAPHTDPAHSPQLQQLAAQLHSLGAETPSERNVKRVLPWVLSIMLHVAIGLTAVFITWTVVQRTPADESVLVVADFNALQYEPVAALEVDLPQQQQAQPVIAPAPLVKSSSELLQQVTSSDADLLGDLAAAVNAGSGSASLSQFAPRSNGLEVTFAGLTGSNARDIVYAIDASGSMIASFQFVLEELSRSLSNLSPQQRFAVIFFQADRAIEVPPAGRLTNAGAPERDRAMQWIRQNVVPRGGTNPMLAIERALRLKPNVIFLLSQDITGYGEFEVDQRDLMAMLDQRNPIDPQTGRRVTQINCIQFLEEDPLGTMKQIAQEHGGPNAYQLLTRSDLGLGN